MKKPFFIVFLLFSFLTYGRPTDLERVELILFTTPYCEICPNLKRLIKKKGILESISYSYKGKVHFIPFKTIDPYSMSKKELKLLEYEKVPSLPYLGVYKSGFFSQKFLIKGRPLGRFDQRDLKLLKLKVISLGKSFFQIKKNEAIEDFQERIDDVFLLNFPSLQSFIAEALKHKSPPSLKEVETSLGMEIGGPLNLSGKDISAVNVIYIGNADNPINNPLFTPIVLNTIQKNLSNLGFNNQKQGITLFGSGQNKIRDVLKMKKEDEYILVSHPFSKNINGAFNRKNVKELFSHLGKQENKKGLFIMVGHGAQDGALLWFEKERLEKNELKRLHLSTKGQNIIVSGTCYGGQFYDALSCGFFGAHPKTPAIGCWSSENQIISKKDYTRTFFSSLKERKEADLNGDGKLSFQEMHWYASLHGPKEDLPFTSLDGLARTFFKKYPNFLQQKNSIENLMTYGNPGEKYVLRKLKKGLDDKQKIIMEEVKTLKFKAGGETFKIKLDVLNPLSSQLIFRFNQKERQLILSIIKRKINHDFEKGIKKISFQKFGKKIFFKVFFKTGKIIRFYDDLQRDESGNLISDFFKLKLTEKEKDILNKTKPEKVFSKSFIIFPENFKSLKKEYLQLEFLEEFIKTSKNGKRLSIGIKYKDAHDPWPKIHTLKTINNILPKYRLLMPQLMKRLLFKKLVVNYPNYLSRFQSFKRCENQSIEDFLKNK
ncbi:MAG: hypothetical protein VYD54_04465 [Bdellovibrionota bacterium]|nr:hypothetical protein [Bdellovibrionota bacterium]